MHQRCWRRVLLTVDILGKWALRSLPDMLKRVSGCFWAWFWRSSGNQLSCNCCRGTENNCNDIISKKEGAVSTFNLELLSSGPTVTFHFTEWIWGHFPGSPMQLVHQDWKAASNIPPDRSGLHFIQEQLLKITEAGHTHSQPVSRALPESQSPHSSVLSELKVQKFCLGLWPFKGHLVGRQDYLWSRPY